MSVGVGPDRTDQARPWSAGAMLQNVLAINLVVEQVEPERRLRLRLTISFL
jgi:hypothetical protein